MHGLLLIDKPVGPTSFDVVRALRRAARIRKVGHTGTLDPLASGLLICCLGQATKLVPFLLSGEKRYLARVALGVETDTGDAGGAPVDEAPVATLDGEQVRAALSRFVGRIRQSPPRFSAIKKGGVPLYRKARRGDEFPLEEREVEILSLDLIAWTGSGLTLDVRCGKGTYIRSLARDIARALGTRGHLAELRRVENAGFCVDRATPMAEMESPDAASRLAEKLIPPAEALPGMPRIRVDAEGAARIACGQALPLAQLPPDPVADAVARGGYAALIDEGGVLLAVARVFDEHLRPLRVLR